MQVTDSLLDAAESRMRIGGYNSVSFRDLAADVGIKSSSVHYHFQRKEDLARALVQRYSDRFFERLCENAKHASSLESRLKAYAHTFKAALDEQESTCLCGLLGSEIGALPNSLQSDIRGFFERNLEWLDSALPDTLPSPDRQTIAKEILSAHQGAMMLAVSLGDPEIFTVVTMGIIARVAKQK